MSVETSDTNGQNHDEPEGLPLRWVVILAIAAAAGVSVGLAAGVTYGVGTALAVSGLFQRVIR